jgi:HTH-type transcriptional regulator/antitoxin HigA
MDIKPICSEEDYEAALALVELLMTAEYGTPEAMHLDALATLIEAYEAEHYPMEAVSDRVREPR